MLLTHEMIDQAKKAASFEELFDLATKMGMEITTEQAEVYYSRLHPQTGELCDLELENVSGGGCGSQTTGVQYQHYTYFSDNMDGTARQYHGCCTNCSSKLYYIYYSIPNSTEPSYRCCQCGQPFLNL